MVSNITLTGMVLVAAPVNDYDKRLVILTKERGKITAFAKGARRPNSKFVAGSRPFSFGEFTLYQGRDAYTLFGINITNYFEDMTTDIDKVYYSTYFMELAEYFSRENIEAKDMLNLIYVSFNTILKDVIPLKLIKLIYELKIFTINGIYPNVYECTECGAKEGINYFSLIKDGAICKECKNAVKDAIEIDTSTFYTIQFIISSPIGKLYSFTVSEQVMTEFNMIMSRWMSLHCDKKFKSLELIF